MAWGCTAVLVTLCYFAVRKNFSPEGA